jgi:hypothetical protein
MNRAQRRANRTSRKRTTIAGLSFLAMTAMATGYTQGLRTSQVYATGPTCTVNVGTDDDTISGGAGSNATGDLRYCINLLNSGSGVGGTIAFAPSVSLVTTKDAMPLIVKDTTITGNAANPTQIRRTTIGSPTFGFLKSGGDPNAPAYPDLTLESLDIQGFTDMPAQFMTPTTQGVIYSSYRLPFGAVTIDNSDIEGNSGKYAPISIRSQSLNVTDSTFDSNTSTADAGAILWEGIDATIESSTFTSNSGPKAGGALYLEATTSVVISDSTFSGNSVTGIVYDGEGGAVSSISPITSVYGSTFTNNDSHWKGGALYLKGGNPGAWLVKYSTFEGNESGRGGAIYADYTNGVVTNSSLINNRTVGAYAGGDAIHAGYGSSLSLNFTTVTETISDNAADIAMSDGGSSNRSLTLKGAVISSLGQACDLSPTEVAVVDEYAVATDSSCRLTGANSVQSATASSLDLGVVQNAIDDSGVTQSYLTPGADSILVTGAAPNDLGAGVGFDQMRTPRSAPFTIGAIQVGGTPPPPPPPPPTPLAPSAPLDVTAAGTDRGAVVAWQPPQSPGSFPVSNYRVSASPGGASCLTASLTCTVSGLTNGTTYTFTVEALNGAGWGPASAASNAVVPGGVTPAPAPEPLPAPVPLGDHLLQVDGVVDPNVEVQPNPTMNGLNIEGDNWTMELDGLGPDGKPLDLGPNNSLRLAIENEVVTEGTGFLPNSDVDLYINPPVATQGSTVRTQAGEAIYVGTVKTNARGVFSGTATLPEDLPAGEHVLQAVGYSPTFKARAMSLGVSVDAWIVLDQGTRKANGVHDRIITGGTSEGIPAGARLTPLIRYSGQRTFQQGKATITVAADGTFRWTRKIKTTRGLTAYVTYQDTNSNRVFWAKVR